VVRGAGAWEESDEEVDVDADVESRSSSSSMAQRGLEAREGERGGKGGEGGEGMWGGEAQGWKDSEALRDLHRNATVRSFPDRLTGARGRCISPTSPPRSSSPVVESLTSMLGTLALLGSGSADAGWFLVGVGFRI
jgi:hypothetical protein